ncbi:hypothetical protein N3K66_007156 [Trichothecium roseum]|uniref:Uncharacterized protein n=1 Tax=Trichothecium roseum TaxID=47278 RepID=A0ACC0UXE6_9HYPO|nr:hypothetical protein N3K66_007156 [Trichothecium roseum]
MQIGWLPRELDVSAVRLVVLSPDIDDLVSDRLPSYMVPSLYFTMAQLPTTATGKIDRRRLRQIGASYTMRQLAELSSKDAKAKQMPSTEVETQLQSIWAQVLNLDKDSIGVDDSFFRLGGDSITAMQISSAARAAGLNVTTADIMNKKTIGRLGRSAIKPIEAFSFGNSQTRGEPFDLSPIQKLYMQSQSNALACFDQSFLLEITETVPLASIQTGLERLVDKHDMLRSRFIRGSDGIWKQRITSDTEGSFSLRQTGTAGVEIAQVISESRGRLDIENGPLIVAHLFDKDDADMKQLLSLSIHHLVIDLVSWRVLLQELEALLRFNDFTAEPSISFQSWCAAQINHVTTTVSPTSYRPFEARKPQLEYWGQRSHIDATAEFVLDQAVTSRLLGACNDALHTKPFEIMMAALIHSFHQSFPDRWSPTVYNETHGREPWDSRIDISRTVGWFTSMHPVQVSENAGGDLLSVVREVKDCARNFPNNGWLYFASGMINNSTALVCPHEITFNYSGLYQQLENDQALFRRKDLPEGSEPAAAHQVSRFSLFDILINVQDGRAHVAVIYDTGLDHQAEIADWILGYQASLKQVAEFLGESKGMWTLSDFPLAFTSYDDLDRFYNINLPQLNLTAEEIEDIYPCSPMQEGILASQQKDPDTYRCGLLLDAGQGSKRSIQVGRVKTAWEAVVRQHEILRSIPVHAISGSSKSYNIVLKNPQPTIYIFESDKEVVDVAFFRARTGHLSRQKQGLQHELSICQLANGKVFIFLDVNHAIIDAHTLRLLRRDLQTAYNGRLQPSDASYKSFISFLDTEPEKEANEYWSSYLVGAEPCHFPQLADATLDGGRPEHVSLRVPDLDAAGLQAFCRQNEITPATLIQTAWAMVLKRYTGSSAPCFGNLASGRDLPIDEADEIAGPLIGMLTCYIPLDTSKSLLEILKTVQANTISSLQHQTTSLASVHKMLQLGSSTLFNSIFSIQHLDQTPSHNDTGGIRLETSDIVDPTEYDVVVTAGHSETRLDIAVTFSSDFMTHEQGHNLTQCLGDAIKAIVTHAALHLNEIDMMPESEKEKIWKLNQHVPEALDECVHRLIEIQVKSRPHSVALDACDGTITYGELDGFANQLAHTLHNSGIKTGSIVPLCFGRSKWTTVAVVAVLKTGAAFVMIEPTQPYGRLASIMEQTSAKLMLASKQQHELSHSLCDNVAKEAEHLAAEVVQPSGAGGNALLAVFFSSAKAKESVAVVTIPAHAEDAIAVQVPSYMVPSVYFEMSRLPMTVTGKIDRKRLREVAASFSAQQLTDLMTQSAGGKLMPSTDMERQLQLLWSQVLNLEPTQIGAHDSFFRLGGDSIGAMRLVAQGRLNSLHFTVADVFQKPRLSALAQVAQVKDLIGMDLVAPFSLLKDTNDMSSIIASLSGLCRISPDMIEDVYPSTPLQQGLLAMASKSPGSYTLRAVLELSPAVDIIRFRDVWERAVRKIPILRTRIVEYGNLGLLQAVIKDDEIDWIEAESLEAYLAEDGKKAMVLGHPLARYALVGKGKKYFVWTLHHALYDGGSLPLTLDFVEKLYSGGDDGTNTAKTVDIRPFVKHLISDNDAQASEYWRSQFSQNESAIYPNLPATCVEPRPSSVMKRSYALPSTLRYSDHTLATNYALAIEITPKPDEIEMLTMFDDKVLSNWEMDNVLDQFSHTLNRLIEAGQQTTVQELSTLAPRDLEMLWRWNEHVPVASEITSRIFNFSANSFDVFIYETMMALTNGACLCVPSDTDRKDRLESSMRELAASILITTPSVTKLLTPAEVPALEMIWVGGEPITLTEAGRWRNHARVLNCFGPAECCPVSILNHTAQDLSTVTRIGKGAGVVTWVVDATDHNSGHGAAALLAVFLSVGRPTPADASVRILTMPTQVEDELSDRLPSYMVPSVFIGVPELPLTTNGKTDRKRLREIVAGYTAQQLVEMSSQLSSKRQPSTETERSLQLLWSRVLNIELGSIGVDDTFTRLGGDSITAMQISSAARGMGLSISTADVLQKKTISKVARTALLTTQAVASQWTDNLDTPFGLSPIQKLYMQSTEDPTANFDQSFLLELSETVDRQLAKDAFDTLVSRHSMLRANFSRAADGSWQQSIKSVSNSSLNMAFMETDDPDDIAGIIASARAKLDIQHGPLIAAALIDQGNNSQLLFISIHHLVIDLVSWRVLLQDLEALLRSQALSPAPAMSFQSWYTAQAEYIGKISNNPASASPITPRKPELEYWGDVRTGKHITDSFVLDQRSTSALLGDCNEALRTRPPEIMIAALIHSFSLTFPDRASPAIFTETHGRETWNNSIDISQTVGWFTSMYPIQVSEEASPSFLHSLRETKDCARSFSYNGWLYFASLLQNNDATKSHGDKFPTEITFNYSGLYQQLETSDALFKNVPFPAGCEPPSEEAFTLSLFEIIFSIQNGCAHVSVTYDAGLKHQDGITTWVENYRRALFDAVALLKEAEPEWTLSDFPSVFNSYQDIGTFHAETLASLNIEMNAVESIYPCSPMQEGILTSQQKDPASYRCYTVFQVKESAQGSVDLDRIKAAWKAVVLQHELLRTIFISAVPNTAKVFNMIIKDPSPSIVILDQVDEDVNVEYFRARHDVDQQAKGHLEHHLSICRHKSGQVYVCLYINHALIDAHSQRIIQQDFVDAYNGNFTASGAPPYKSFVDYLEEQSHDEAQEYWMDRLRGAEPCHFPQLVASDETDRTAKRSLTVPNLESNVFSVFCREHEITPATLIQAAWAMVLQEYTGSLAVSFGNLASGRDLPIDEVNGIVGPLIGMTTCHVRLDPDATVLETLQAIQSDGISSLKHQTTSLASIHKILELKSTALFNSIMSVQRMSESQDGDSDFAVFDAQEAHDPTDYDMVVASGHSEKRLYIHVTYSTNLLTDTQGVALVERLSSVLRTIVERPNAPLRELDSMPAEEKETIWSRNHQLPLSIDRCIHDMFADQVKARPDAPAVEAWDGNLTYKELDEMTTLLALRLVSLGVKEGDIVPLLFERTMWTTVAVVAVLKAGGCFVVLEPSHPESRLALIVKQSAASLVLSSEVHCELASRLGQRGFIVGPHLAMERSNGTLMTSHLPKPSPSSPCYVVFTSGSTGTPKGVIIPHGALCTNIYYQADILGFHRDSRVLNFAANPFDLFAYETTMALANASVRLLP